MCVLNHCQIKLVKRSNLGIILCKSDHRSYGPSLALKEVQSDAHIQRFFEQTDSVSELRSFDSLITFGY